MRASGGRRARSPAKASAAAEAIPSGHKVADAADPAGEIVRKYGQVIGAATADIAPGAHVHTHNLAMSALREDAGRRAPRQRQEPPRTFEGYRRANGKVGVRNYIGVLTSVNCSATVARHIAEAAERSGLLDDYPDVDGVVPITHASGCGMAGSGEGFEILRRTLWGTAANPNFGGVLLVGPRLRGGADRPAEERLRPCRRRDASSPSPSRRPAARGAPSTRGWRGCRRCCRWSARRAAQSDAGQRAQCSACSAAARTPGRASPRTQRWASPPTGWWASAAR